MPRFRVTQYTFSLVSNWATVAWPTIQECTHRLCSSCGACMVSPTEVRGVKGKLGF